MDFLVICPKYLDDIVQRMLSRDWLVHNFNPSNNEDIYNVANYLHNIELEKYKYTAYLDLNILRYLTNATNSEKPTELSRDAVAFLVFFQIAQIDVDPTYAIYERINYDHANIDDGIRDLEIFNAINNHETEKLAKYALGFIDCVRPKHSTSDSAVELRQWYEKYSLLPDWDSLYLLILVITHITIDSKIERKNKLETFVKWCVEHFRLSLPSIVYASVVFSHTPFRGMMKFKETQSAQVNLDAVHNMTWDLYYMDRFFKFWINKSPNEEQILISADRPFSSLLKIAIELQKQGDIQVLAPFLGESQDRVSEMLINPNSQRIDRVYNSSGWTPEHRADLINEFQLKLGISKLRA